MKGTLIKSICFALFWCGIAQLATAQGIVVNKKDGTKVYYKASEVLSVGVFGYGEGPDDTSDHHEYVDLGLPSGTLWATTNIGANKPEEYGDYFAWGETQPKENYSWSTYKFYNTSKKTVTKYGSVDKKYELEMGDDAATINWGYSWQTPSVDQFNELVNGNYTTTTWTTQNGINGRLIVSKKNGNKVFLPASGGYSDTSLTNVGYFGFYWSRSQMSSDPLYGYLLQFDSDDIGPYYGSWRCDGNSVRPVRVQE